MSTQNQGRKIEAKDVIKGFVKLRDQRAYLKKAFEEEDAKLKAKMEKLDAWLLETMQTTGTTQLGSEYGVAYSSIKVRANCTDWPTTWDFMAENKRFDMMEKRLSVKAVQDYFNESGEFPPGVNVTQEMTVVVRRK